MGKKFEAAQVRVRLPQKHWKSKGEVESWARDQLAGGPPSLHALVPDGYPDAGKPATWKHVQDGLLAGQFVTLVSDPTGLIVTDSETGMRSFVPSASRSGLVLGKTNATKFIGSIEDERALREFVKNENSLFNKVRQKQAEVAGNSWTFAWYHHGRRIRQFVREHPRASTERVWSELVRWGKGQDGYSRQTHQDATYFYDWLEDVEDTHPIFQFGTTRIQHILWADRTKPGRDRLLASIVYGPLNGLSDDEFAWVMGKRTKNWPLNEGFRTEIVGIGRSIRVGSQITTAEGARLLQLLRMAKIEIVKENRGLPSE